MISEDKIRAALDNVLETTEFSSLGEVEHGKVRDSYKQEERRIIVVTDRISCFDCIMGTVPFKGQVLNQMAAFWFENSKDVVANHVIDVPDPNVMIVKECEQLPIEFVVRGYITGVTKTSAWYNYDNGVRNFCGNLLPEGLVKDQKLDEPILTPTTKHEKHDRPISREEAIAEGLIDGDTYDEAAEICFKLYARAVEHAAKQGLIFVDTKYEIGRYNGELIVTDEINTPDSSRYWFSDTYEELFAARKEQRKLDKEYVRQWLAQQGFLGDGPLPALSDEVRIEAAKRYINAYELISGQEFVISDEPVLQRIEKAMEGK